MTPSRCLALTAVLTAAVWTSAAAQSSCKLNPATLFQPAGFAQLVIAPDQRTVYIAGQVAQDSSGAVIGAGNFTAQATQVFTNLRAALAAVDADFRSVVKWNIYVTDVANLPTLRAARNAALGEVAPPASTLVQVPALYRPELLLEIEAVAVLPQLADCAALRKRERAAPR